MCVKLAQAELSHYQWISSSLTLESRVALVSLQDATRYRSVERDERLYLGIQCMVHWGGAGCLVTLSSGYVKRHHVLEMPANESAPY